ncbi:DUF1631 family protein [Microbulbifer sp. SAOS-129_SWC]|uniref:DUF1631 family protein n=1 Tax=Microbulbifer sp. SAOS-129_SWC TaxID=3145235 RepID=UPI003217D086
MDTQDFPKVVAFSGNAKRGGNAADTPARPLPKPVAAVRDSACSWLFARMKEVFTGVDDALFASAEKVHHQDEQDGLFHALRLLRLERGRITERFINAVRDGFHNIEKEPRSVDSDDTDAGSGLALLDDEDLEQQVALKTIIVAVKRDFASPIAELALRLDTLLPQKVYDENMPLSPGMLCRALQHSLKSLDIHLRARLTLLKKFEQLFAAKLDGLYRACNQVLIDNGVLPSLKDPLLQQRRNDGRGSTETVTGPAAGASPDLPGGIPGSPLPPQPTSGHPVGANPISAAFPGVAPVGAGAAGAGSVGAGAAGTGAPTGPAMAAPGSAAGNPGSGGYGLLPPGVGVAPMATPDLLQHLGAMQSLPLQAASVGQVLDVNRLLQQRLVEARQGASLQELDTEVIRMVDMLFTFMLEDRNLAEPIKVQLIRLQLPLLKLGVADKAFFTKSGHPARKLFNTLADAAIGWQPGENYQEEPFYREVCDIVEQVLQGFDSDEDIFTRLLRDFEEYVTREHRRAQVMQRRTVDEAEGHARVEAARARVAAVFDALTAERKLPRVVQEWLGRVWDSVLFRTCLKEGTSSEGWRRAVLTARDLVWSVVAPMPESRFKMQQLLPGLRKRLNQGAESLAIGVAERRRLLAGLDQLYRERQALGARVESERERRTRERLVQELRREADSILAIPEVDQAPAPEVAQAPTPEVAQTPADSAVETEASDTGDPVDLQEPPQPPAAPVAEIDVDLPAVETLQQVAQAAPLAAANAPPAGCDDFWRQTYHLKDSWFMQQVADKPPVRCHLAAIIRDLDQFMFVNRRGAKVTAYSRAELARALRDGEMRPLEQGPLFDRALKWLVESAGEMAIAVSVSAEEGEA